MPEPVPPADFPTTQRSRIVAAADKAEPGANEAFADLCSAYWLPLYAYSRHKGNKPDRALDLTQSYSAHLLERQSVAASQGKRDESSAELREAKRINPVVSGRSSPRMPPRVWRS